MQQTLNASAYIRIIAQALKLQEKQLPSLLTGTGLSTQVLEPGNTLPVSGEALVAAIRNSLRLSGGGEIGLRVGDRLRPASHGPLGYLTLSTPDLLSALQALRDFLPTRLQTVSISIEQNHEWLDCVLYIPEPWSGELPVRTYLAECFGLVLQSLVEEVLGRDAEDAVLQLQHPRPAYSASYNKYLNGEWQFDQNRDCYRLPAYLAHAPNVKGDSQAYRMAFELCSSLLQKNRGGQQSTAQQVRSALLLNPMNGISEAEVAASLLVSRRTLSRRLQAQGTSFRAIRETLLNELAQAYLRDSDQSVESIALAMGYNDSAAFRKAFRRWTGTTPQAFRASGLGVR